MPAIGLAEEAVDFLSLLSDVNRARVLEASRRTEYPAGTVAFRARDTGRAFLLQRGLVRVYWDTADGRQATIAYIHPGNLVGGRNLVAGSPTVRGPSLVSIQVVVDSTLMILDLEAVRSLAAREIEVVSAIATQLAARVRYDIRVVAVRSLGSLLERLAFDLLERASRSQLAVGRLEARATHEELADSIGSAREVVSRALKGLRAAGIVDTAPGLVRVKDPEGLAAIVRAFAI
jgi:CRP-like cAMP-binding protein